MTDSMGSSGVPVRRLVERLAAVPGRADRLTHVEVLPPATRSKPIGRTGFQTKSDGRTPGTG